MATRIFNGRRYTAITSYPKKRDARNKAFQERIGGIRRARVVYERPYWVVYTRKVRY